jgi:hypothetical protein
MTQTGDMGRETFPKLQFSLSRQEIDPFNSGNRLPNQKGFFMKTNTANNLALAAAFAGLLGGTTARVNAQPVSTHTSISENALLLAGTPAEDKKDLPKHSCKGKNDCKGQGGGDAKHWGKNSCKGKGACATDGSKG